MAYLQLADNGQEVLPQEVLEFMLQIPNEWGGMSWVREDQLDHLPDEVLYQIMQQQPHMSGIRDWFGRMKQRKMDRREQKAIDKQSGKESRFAWREKKRGIRAGRKGGTFIDRLTSGVSGIMERIPGGGGGYEDETRGGLPQFTGGLNVGVAKWWQNPMTLGVIAVVVIGGTIVISKAMKDKK